MKAGCKGSNELSFVALGVRLLNTPSTELGNALLEAHVRLDDLRVPPANRPEALRGDRLGQHSVRVNEQWRFCFVWRDSDAWEVGIVD